MQKSIKAKRIGTVKFQELKAAEQGTVTHWVVIVYLLPQGSCIEAGMVAVVVDDIQPAILFISHTTCLDV